MAKRLFTYLILGLSFPASGQNIIQTGEEEIGSGIRFASLMIDGQEAIVRKIGSLN